MLVATIILGVWGAAASAVAWRLWRDKLGLLTRLQGLAADCEKAGSENQRLKTALSAHQSLENGRISRLEHDLKSPLGVILGYSMLLREFVQDHSSALPAFPLRSVDGIDQAAQKMLQIIEAAARPTAPDAAQTEAAVEGKQ
jgi:signal transduction histidine kinase